MNKLRQHLKALAWLTLAACSRERDPRPQWIVHIGTDAPLPNFGDRIRVDVFDDNGVACAECTQSFAVRESDVGPDALPFTFGVVPVKGKTWIRARLFRATNVGPDGAPNDPIIDYLGALPELGQSPLDVKVLLSMSCYGKPADVPSHLSCDPTSSHPPGTLVVPSGIDLPAPGSWGPTSKPCPSDTPPDMACISGGLFLLGSRQFIPFGNDFDPVPEQLVHVPTFWMDENEVTVGTMRSLLGSSITAPPIATSDSPGHTYCTFNPKMGVNDAESVSCVDKRTAEQACKALGKRLPTEAEWEFAAGQGILERLYPFVTDDPEPTTAILCSTAVVARDQFDGAGSRKCVLEAQEAVGPDTEGSGDDRTLTTTDPSGQGAELRNMGGNLSEWVADDFATYSDVTCWGPDVALHDNPHCSKDPALGVLKGGNWTSFIYNVHSFFRESASIGVQVDSVGFRCVEDLP